MTEYLSAGRRYVDYVFAVDACNLTDMENCINEELAKPNVRFKNITMTQRGADSIAIVAMTRIENISVAQSGGIVIDGRALDSLYKEFGGENNASTGTYNSKDSSDETF